MAPADSACATASRATLLKFTKRGKESQAPISPRAEWCSECSQISFVQKSSNKRFGVFNQQTSRFVVEIANLCVLVYKHWLFQTGAPPSITHQIRWNTPRTVGFSKPRDIDWGYNLCDTWTYMVPT